MEELTQVKELLMESCCLIVFQGMAVGTGWLFNNNKIVSAGHCFTGLQERKYINPKEINNQQIEAHFFNQSGENIYSLQFLCGVYTKKPLVDFCILDAKNVTNLRSLPIANTICLEGRFYTAGFGKTLQRISNAEGDIIGLAQETGGRSVLKLSSEQCCEEGYSGCPIYSSKARGVIGIQSEITKKNVGSESKTILAYPIMNLVEDNVLKRPESFHGLPKYNDLDIGMHYRNQGDRCFEAKSFKEAREYYIQAKIYLTNAIGERGAYINDIDKRIKRCKSS